jgi:hypothetical protein
MQTTWTTGNGCGRESWAIYLKDRDSILGGCFPFKSDEGLDKSGFTVLTPYDNEILHFIRPSLRS